MHHNSSFDGIKSNIFIKALFCKTHDKTLMVLILILEKESETISVDDVSDIFKMYGVDYKDVCIKYVIEVFFKMYVESTTRMYVSNMFWKSASNIRYIYESSLLFLQSMVKDMDSYIDRCIGKDDFFKLATVNSVKNYPHPPILLPNWLKTGRSTS